MPDSQVTPVSRGMPVSLVTRDRLEPPHSRPPPQPPPAGSLPPWRFLALRMRPAAFTSVICRLGAVSGRARPTTTVSRVTAAPERSACRAAGRPSRTHVRPESAKRLKFSELFSEPEAEHFVPDGVL